MRSRAGGAHHRRPKKTMRGAGVADLGRSERSEVMLAVTELAPHVGMKRACRAFALHRGAVYRARIRHRAAPPTMCGASAATAAPGPLGRRAGVPARCARQ